MAADVEQEHLSLSRSPLQRSAADWDVSFVNAKGFGGNNATGTVVSPRIVSQWLGQRHGGRALAAWRERNAAVLAAAEDWDRSLTDGTAKLVYRFDHEVRSEEHVRIENGMLYIEGLAPIDLLG